MDSEFWRRFSTIHTGLVAGASSLIPTLLALIWKSISPGYRCNLLDPSPLGTLDSPCFGVMLPAAYGIGWIVGKIGDRTRDGRAAEQADMATLDQIDLNGRLVAGAIGLVVGIPFGAIVLNPCP